MLRKRVGWLFASVIAAWMAAAVWYLWPRWHSEPRVGGVVVFPDPDVRRSGAIALGVLLAALLTFLLVTALRQPPRRLDRMVTLVAGQLAIALFPVPALVLALSVVFSALAPPWYDLDARRVGTTTYHLQMRRSDARLLLTAELPRTRLFLRTRVVAVSSREHQVLTLVRPVGRPEYALDSPESIGAVGLGQLVLDPPRRWLLFIYPASELGGSYVTPTGSHVVCLTDAAYDLRTHTFCTGPALARVSPLLLVGPRDQLDLSDRRNAEEAAKEMAESGETDDAPPAPVLVAELQNPNPRVRALVAELLSYYEAEPAIAQGLDRAQRDSDASVRAAAHRALLNLRQPEAPAR